MGYYSSNITTQTLNTQDSDVLVVAEAVVVSTELVVPVACVIFWVICSIAIYTNAINFLHAVCTHICVFRTLCVP